MTHIVDVKVGNENSYASIVRPSEDGTSSNTTGPTTIAPMQSFFVTVGEETISCDITFTEQMLVPGTDKITVSPEEAPTIEENTISITASASDTRSSAMIRFSASASDNYRERVSLRLPRIGHWIFSNGRTAGRFRWACTCQSRRM